MHTLSPQDVSILLVSCYELGHVPLGAAGPAGVLRSAGFRVDAVDTSVTPLHDELLATQSVIGFSTPMHTAMRLAIPLARRVREVNPNAHICFYGVYAALHHDIHPDVADSCLGAEFEADLLDLAGRIATRPPGLCPRDVVGTRRAPARDSRAAVRARRSNRPAVLSSVPDRDVIARHAGHAHFTEGTRTVPAASTVTTRGCRYLCRHCPLPAVYQGTFYALPVRGVLDDIRALVDGGARHITFADPDFLNAPRHALTVARGLHRAHPGVTFDYTARIDHLLRYPAAVDELQALGNRFVVSAVESFSDTVLNNLAKGHTRAEALAVIRRMRARRLALRPSFVPFSPWETRSGVSELLHIVVEEGLVGAVDPVQYGIRLLVPPHSLLLGNPAMRRYLDTYDREALTWTWRHPDPAMDALQSRIARIAARDSDSAVDPITTFDRIRNVLAADGAGDAPVATLRGHAGSGAPPPRLTESWFC